MSGFRDFFLFDPDRPLANPDELLASRGGQMTDPHLINHNCPFCNRTLAWDLFKAHARPCYRKWRTRKVFRGAQIA